MLGLILNRLAQVAFVLAGLTVLTFLLVRAVPTDPATILAGEGATAEQLATIRERYGFDRPLHEQFAAYVGQLARGDLGISVYTSRPVATDLVQRLPATVELALAALVLAIALGIPMGVLAATSYRRMADHLLRVLSMLGLAVASFWLAIMLQMTLSLNLGWFPLRGRIDTVAEPPPGVTGLFTIDYLLAGQPAMAWQALVHLALPAVTLALPAMATISRFVRSSLIETLQKDFVAYEIAMGYPRRVVIWKYALRNSLSATVTQIGLLVGLLLSGSIVVEAIFSWPGLGDYIYRAIITGDTNPVLSATLLIGVIYAVANILVDVIQALIDPRVRSGR